MTNTCASNLFLNISACAAAKFGRSFTAVSKAWSAQATTMNVTVTTSKGGSPPNSQRSRWLRMLTSNPHNRMSQLTKGVPPNEASNLRFNCPFHIYR